MVRSTRLLRHTVTPAGISLAAALAAAGALAGTGLAGSKTAAANSPTQVRISTRAVAGLGTVLVNAQGRTLYMFVPDKDKRVTCVRTCAAVWPPLKLPHGAKPLVSGRAKAALVSSDPDPAGGRVLTYAHWPLYTYVADKRAGVAKGQALNLNGGLWYVLSPAGKVIRAKPHAAAAYG